MKEHLGTLPFSPQDLDCNFNIQIICSKYPHWPSLAHGSPVPSLLEYRQSITSSLSAFLGIQLDACLHKSTPERPLLPGSQKLLLLPIGNSHYPWQDGHQECVGELS